MVNISHNARTSTSKSGPTCTMDHFPSLDASECDRCPPNVELVAEAYPSPPASESCDFIPSGVESHTSQDLDFLPFPLNPVSLPTSNSNAVANRVDPPRTPGRRRHSTRNYLTPPVQSLQPTRSFKVIPTEQVTTPTFQLREIAVLHISYSGPIRPAACSTEEKSQGYHAGGQRCFGNAFSKSDDGYYPCAGTAPGYSRSSKQASQCGSNLELWRQYSSHSLWS